MPKRKKHTGYRAVDRAMNRMMFKSKLEKAKNIGLFIAVTIFLTWLILGVL